MKVTVAGSRGPQSERTRIPGGVGSDADDAFLGCTDAACGTECFSGTIRGCRTQGRPTRIGSERDDTRCCLMHHREADGNVADAGVAYTRSGGVLLECSGAFLSLPVDTTIHDGDVLVSSTPCQGSPRSCSVPSGWCTGQLRRIRLGALMRVLGSARTGLERTIRAAQAAPVVILARSNAVIVSSYAQAAPVEQRRRSTGHVGDTVRLGEGDVADPPAMSIHAAGLSRGKR